MLSFLVFIEAHPRPTCSPSNFPRFLSPQVFTLSPTLTLHKSFNCNTYKNLRKCCKQKTCSITKSFRCNTYKKRGGHILQAKSPSPSARFTTFGLVFEPSHLPYTLPSSVSSNSFACHSYENTGGVGVFFPFWNSFHAAKRCSRTYQSLPRYFSTSAPLFRRRPIGRKLEHALAE
jgi:hypothetical protein